MGKGLGLWARHLCVSQREKLPVLVLGIAPFCHWVKRTTKNNSGAAVACGTTIDCTVSSPVRALPPPAGAGQSPGFCTYLLAAVLQHSFPRSDTSGQSWSDCAAAVVPWVRGVV